MNIAARRWKHLRYAVNRYERLLLVDQPTSIQSATRGPQRKVRPEPRPVVLSSINIPRKIHSLKCTTNRQPPQGPGCRFVPALSIS